MLPSLLIFYHSGNCEQTLHLPVALPSNHADLFMGVARANVADFKPDSAMYSQCCFAVCCMQTATSGVVAHAEAKSRTVAVYLDFVRTDDAGRGGFYVAGNR